MHNMQQCQMKLERLGEWTRSSNITCLLNMGEGFLFLQVHYLESLGFWWLAWHADAYMQFGTIAQDCWNTESLQVLLG